MYSTKSLHSPRTQLSRHCIMSCKQVQKLTFYQTSPLCWRSYPKISFIAERKGRALTRKNSGTGDIICDHPSNKQPPPTGLKFEEKHQHMAHEPMAILHISQTQHSSKFLKQSWSTTGITHTESSNEPCLFYFSGGGIVLEALLIVIKKEWHLNDMSLKQPRGGEKSGV